MSAQPALRLATRGSRLARTQTAMVAAALEQAGVATETVVIRTQGDARAFDPSESVAGEGWFTTELERALLEGRCDAAVHSAKDLPTQCGEGLGIAAYLDRADPADAAVTRDGRRMERLAPGSTVGTSSPRRRELIMALYPALAVVPMSGNVDTRLARLDAADVDAIVVACAGLLRLGTGDRIAERLDPHRFVPAAAQGAIAVQTVEGTDAARLCSALHHTPTGVAVEAERAVLRSLGGGCLLPLGAWARFEAHELVLTGAHATSTGIRVAEVRGSAADSAGLGVAVAARIR